jgi:hypothetical protein
MVVIITVSFTLSQVCVQSTTGISFQNKLTFFCGKAIIRVESRRPLTTRYWIKARSFEAHQAVLAIIIAIAVAFTKS